jgi:hypothetical protein
MVPGELQLACRNSNAYLVLNAALLQCKLIAVLRWKITIERQRHLIDRGSEKVKWSQEVGTKEPCSKVKHRFAM